MDKDSAAAAYFAAVWRNLLEITFWDDVRRTSARPVEAGGWPWSRPCSRTRRTLLGRPADGQRRRDP
ncbi:hypothetical protein NKG05_19300 [Oerskovia sp. M15]